MKRNIILVAFFSTILIASFLRLWRLGDVPPSPDWDEAALGYNAYSIAQTGRDEYGKPFPIVLRSFDDYKPALYTYLIIPLINIFGLNTFSVRLPSALFGILTIIAVYFITLELFRKREDSPPKDQNSLNDQSYIIPILTPFLLAISPWHLQFSRIAFESNIGLSFNIFSIFFFLKGLKKNVYLPVSALFMAFSLYAYQSEKIFVPLLFLVLVYVFKKQLFLIPKKYILISIILGIIVAAPIIKYTLTQKEALTRARGVSVFTEETLFVKDYTKRLVIDREKNDFIGLILDNRRVAYAKAILSNYLSHYNLYWLFISGDIDRHHAKEMGLLYLWELPFLFLGIYSLIFGPFNQKTKKLVFLWFAIAPVPAAFSTGVPHAVRTLNFLPTFQMFTAIGVLVFVKAVLDISRKDSSIFPGFSFIRRKIKYGVFVLLSLFFIFNFSYYLNQYFVQLNYFSSASWQYGYKEAISEVSKIEDRYDKIIVSNEPYMDQSYMFFLFYLKYPPQKYQMEAKNSSGGFRENHNFGKYEFRPIKWDKEKKNNKSLYVGRPLDFPSRYPVLKTINFIDNSPAISIVSP